MAATSGPARVFGLTVRGAVQPGLRADLVLLDGDPLADIRVTRAVWCGGQQADVSVDTPATSLSRS